MASPNSAMEGVPAQPVWWTVWEFVLHVVVGSTVFAIIALPAVGLNLLVHALEPLKLDRFVTVVLTGAEYAIMLVDIGLLLVFICRAAAKAARSF